MKITVTPCLKPHITSHPKATSEATTSTARPLTANSPRTRESKSTSLSTADGSLATGLSISAAFKNHGEIFVLFVFLNASATSIICSVYPLSGITRVIYQKSPQNHSISKIFTIQIIPVLQSCSTMG